MAETMKFLLWMVWKLRWLITEKDRKGKDWYTNNPGVGDYEIMFNPYAKYPIVGTVNPKAWKNASEKAGFVAGDWVHGKNQEPIMTFPHIEPLQELADLNKKIWDEFSIPDHMIPDLKIDWEKAFFNKIMCSRCGRTWQVYPEGGTNPCPMCKDQK